MTLEGGFEIYFKDGFEADSQSIPYYVTLAGVLF